MLETVEQELRAFLQATIVISGQQYSTVGLGYFALSHLSEYLDEQKESDSPQLNHLKRLLLNQFKKYFEDDVDQLDLLKVKTSLFSLSTNQHQSAGTYAAGSLPFCISS